MDPRWTTIVRNVHSMLNDRRYEVANQSPKSTSTSSTGSTSSTKAAFETATTTRTSPSPLFARYSVTYPRTWPKLPHLAASLLAKNDTQDQVTEQRTVKVMFFNTLNQYNCASALMRAHDKDACNHVIFVGLTVSTACYPVLDHMTQSLQSQYRFMLVEVFDSFPLMYCVRNHALNKANESTLLSPPSSMRRLSELTIPAELGKVTKKQDPVARWWGAQVYQVFDIVRHSEANGDTKDYRVVQA